MSFIDSCNNTMSLHVRTVVWKLPSRRDACRVGSELSLARIGVPRQVMERSSHDRLRQRSSHISSLTASFGPFPFFESLYRPTASIFATLLSLRKISFIFQSCRFSASLTGLDLHYTSSGLYMQISTEIIIQAPHSRAQLPPRIESNASTTESSCSILTTAQFCAR